MKKKQDLVSVIVPVYKVEKYLHKCLDSIVSQTYKNLEIILVDDGSPDNCPQICDDYAKSDNRIKVIHQQNGGLSSARNAGLDVAIGDYICFVDSDDYIHTTYVETLLNNLKETNSDLSVCTFCRVYEGKTYQENLDNTLTILTGDEILTELLHSKMPGTIVAWSKLYKKEIFSDGLRFDIGRIHEDEFIAHKVFTKCNKVVYTSCELYYYLSREGSIIATPTFTQKNMDGYYAAESRYIAFKDTKWKELSLNQFLSTITIIYDIAKKKHANKTFLRFLKQKFDFYYKQSKHTRTPLKIFKFSPFIFWKLKELKSFVKHK